MLVVYSSILRDACACVSLKAAHSEKSDHRTFEKGGIEHDIMPPIKKSNNLKFPSYKSVKF